MNCDLFTVVHTLSLGHHSQLWMEIEQMTVLIHL